ncbi:protein of unknown function [Cupriavidus taiwanensis]|nr:protein of unknown function [Cupriavidus taiwanensis]
MFAFFLRIEVRNGASAGVRNARLADKTKRAFGRQQIASLCKN